MIELRVRPLDPSQPGSYRERKALIRLIRLFGEASDEQNPNGWAKAIEAMDEFLLPRLSTDNGTPVEEVLDMLSADQFDELIRKVTFGAQEAVPEANGGNLPSGVEASG